MADNDRSLYGADPGAPPPEPMKVGDRARLAKTQDARGLGSLKKTGFTPPAKKTDESTEDWMARVRAARTAYDQANAMRKP